MCVVLSGKQEAKTIILASPQIACQERKVSEFISSTLFSPLDINEEKGSNKKSFWCQKPQIEPSTIWKCLVFTDTKKDRCCCVEKLSL